MSEEEVKKEVPDSQEVSEKKEEKKRPLHNCNIIPNYYIFLQNSGEFKNFENEYGLLENLEGWSFIEWSKAADSERMIGVHFPTNMLYAMMLRSVATLYGDEAARKKADVIEKAINKLSPIGMFYCDNAVRGDDGKLHLSGKITETCQYYAFFCGTATPEKNPDLW